MVVIRYAGYRENARCDGCRKDKRPEVFVVEFGKEGVKGALCRNCLLRELRMHGESAGAASAKEPLGNNVMEEAARG